MKTACIQIIYILLRDLLLVLILNQCQSTWTSKIRGRRYHNPSQPNGGLWQPTKTPGGCWNPAYLRLFYNIVPSLTSSHQTDPPLPLYSRVQFALFKTPWLPRWRSGEESACQHRRLKSFGINPWVRKISWRRKWQPALVFLPEKSHEQRDLVGCRFTKSQTQLNN